MANKTTKIEYGDFQTPIELSIQVCKLLRKRGVQPSTVIEPTCGKGSFVFAALRTFSDLSNITCVEYNNNYVEELKSSLHTELNGNLVHISQGDFFQQDWANVIVSASKPVLLLGNPPWVTNAALGKLNGTNLPKKSNFQGYRGFDALTGKSNFDISEWMLIHLLEWAWGKETTVAFLCKTAVARKVIRHRWKYRLAPYAFSIYKFNALKHFGASVDACLFVAQQESAAADKVCCVYDGIVEPILEKEIGIRDGALISNLGKFNNAYDLLGESAYVWRSGVKHDCSKVMELERNENGLLQNKLGEQVDIEDTYLYPLLKSSDVAKGNTEHRRFVVVTQKTTGEETAIIQEKAPNTWRYLNDHADLLNKRGSSIYQNRSPFSIFGIGPYSFSPWKLAISGLYKSLRFTVVGPVDGKPVMLDDTCYFVPCETEVEATLLKQLLEEKRAVDLFHSFIFWDDKRPVTVELLKKLDLLELARQMGVDQEYLHHVAYNSYVESRKKQLLLIRENGQISA